MANLMMVDEGELDRELEAKAEALILRRLGETSQPLTLDEVLAAAKGQHQSLPYSVLRLVLWSLLTSGKLNLTRDWRVQLAR